MSTFRDNDGYDKEPTVALTLLAWVILICMLVLFIPLITIVLIVWACDVLLCKLTGKEPTIVLKTDNDEKLV